MPVLELEKGQGALLPPVGPSQAHDRLRWLLLHADMETHPSYARFPLRCTQLTPEGRCGIYPDRPQVCQDFRAGSEDCLDYVQRRRSPMEYEMIREDGDPESIHHGENIYVG